MNDETKPKNKRGRPKQFFFDAEVLKKIEQLAGLGLTQTQIIDALGMGKTLFYDEKTQNKELVDAIKRGKAAGIATVASKLMAKVQNMDTSSIIFYLKCQAGWRDTQELELSANGNNKLEIVITGGSPTSE